MSTIDGGPGNIITNGLILYLDAANVRSYPTTGTTWTDLSGNGNNGTLTNGPTFNSSNGGSVVFDGVNDYVTCSATPINNTLTNQITIEAFVYPNDTNNYQQIGGGQDNTLYRYTAAFNVGAWGSTFGFDLEATSGQVRLYGSPGYSANVWYHLVGTYDGSIAKLYINNNLIDSDSGTSGNIVDFDSILFGRDISFAAGRAFNGKISSYKIYNQALTAQEVLQNFNATRARFGI